MRGGSSFWEMIRRRAECRMMMGNGECWICRMIGVSRGNLIPAMLRGRERVDCQRGWGGTGRVLKEIFGISNLTEFIRIARFGSMGIIWGRGQMGISLFDMRSGPG